MWTKFSEHISKNVIWLNHHCPFLIHRLTANTLSQLQKRTGPLSEISPPRKNTETNADADTIIKMIKSLQNEIEV